MSLAFLPHNSHRIKRHRGAALILALLVVVIVVLLAGSISADFLVTIRKIENQLHSQQAYSYLRGAEGLARQALQMDYDDASNKDHISEGWLEVPQTFVTEQGVLSGIICDLQGRFNVNNLGASASASDATSGPESNTSSAAAYTSDQEQFIRLLQVLPIDPAINLDRAREITESIIEWMDVNDEVNTLNGVETAYYSDLETPYRAANRPFSDVSELRWIKGIDDVVFSALQPYVMVLDAGVPLNVNAVPVELIQSINSPGDLVPTSFADASAVIEARDGDIDGGELGQLPTEQLNEGFNNVQDFLTQLGLNTSPSAESFAVESEYFLLKTETIFLERSFTLFSLLHLDRQNGAINVIRRGKTGFGQCPIKQ